jgi:flagellar basal body P-ring protein FlgI
LCLAALALYTLVGCQAPSFADAAWPEWASLRSQSPDEEDEDGTKTSGTSLETPYVGEYVTSFGGTGLIPVQGVGLVVGLDGTGEDPHPSYYRTRLLDEMRKHKIEDPNTILASPDTALVMVRAYIPVNIRKGDTFDAEVLLPPMSEATSLAGGYLLEARLTEQRMTQGGRVLNGDVQATVSGPVLVSTTAEEGSSAAGTLRRGRILGGAVSKIDRDLDINLRREYRSGRNTMRIAKVIGMRFHGHEKGLKIPMAEAKTDQLITLKVPDEYKENYPRYLAVIRNMAFKESEIAQRVRLQKLEDQIKIPAESEIAAMRLEAIGPDALPALKRALLTEDIEVRFNAAMALTYMGHTEGLAALAEAARDEPAFRVYALAALACCKEAEASSELQKLLTETSAETRYGAFRALTILNDQDPIVAGKTMKGDYKLHVLNVEGPPMVHLTHHTKAEVVLFGAQQRLQLPATLRAGQHIQVIAVPGSNEVKVSRFSGGQNAKRTVSPNLAEIILACDELGAKYPDIVALLTQAEKQHNLPGELEIDALPAAGRVYVPKNNSGSKRTIGSQYTAPNIYAPPGSDAAEAREEDLKSVPTEAEAAKQQDEPKIRQASASTTGESVVQADASEPAADEPETQDAADRPKWYDPRTFLKRPSWLDDGPPQQWEPDVK